MGQMITLMAADDHALSAYRADPDGTPKGGLVVAQEIFGVNGHIRSVCDGFAADGYAVIAPAYFDRLRPGVDLDYSAESIAAGRELAMEIGWDGAMQDTAAAAEALREVGKVGVVGYCWGGSVAWLASTRLALPAVGYYGGRTAGLIDEAPQAPVMLHFGEKDSHIPKEDVDKIAAAHTDVPIHMYPAGHGFNCDARADFHPESASLARARTLEFFSAALA